ncbi:PASTA domain-containing protein [Cytophaga aurantiaca]|uniref:PASTA domain-containing protein n=1 Tax=Cytophaga aurantiaca TaxID=29530 RepID=UPI00036BF0A6|nr:PASTA domain-containing protein [Cytophaga aurantiaca]
MKLFKADSFKDVLIHLAIIVSIFVVLILIFFYAYLPSVTKHGEYITVPKLEGLTIEQTKKILHDKGLRYEISDSTFKPGIKAFTVLTQHPLAGSEVKENRRIYLSISSLNPPSIKMPDLLDNSQRGAEMQLKSLGLVVGHISTTPNPNNFVLGQSYNGSPIKAGSPIPKGSKIDLLVGSGRGDTEVDVPNLVGMSLDEAKAMIKSMGLVEGLMIIDPSSKEAENTVTKQKPAYQTGQKLRSGDMIDLWYVGGPDTVKP